MPLCADPALGRHDLVRAADLAMRRAKMLGGAAVSDFDHDLDAALAQPERPVARRLTPDRDPGRDGAAGRGYPR